MSPGLRVLRLQGGRISAELNDAYLSPVLQALWDGSAGSGLGERQRLGQLFGLWGAVVGVARVRELAAHHHHHPARHAEDPFGAAAGEDGYGDYHGGGLWDYSDDLSL